MVEIASGKGYNVFRLTIGGNPDYMIRPNGSLVLTISLAFAVPVFVGLGADLKVEGLKCEYRVNPLGLDTPQPRLSWLLESPRRGEKQTAYQVLAASTAE